MFISKIESLPNLSLLTVAVDLPKQMLLIERIKQEMDTEWFRMSNNDDNKHLIDGITSAATKTDAVKMYAEKYATLVFDSQGGWQRGFSKEQISSVNDEALTFLNRVSNTPLNKDNIFVKMGVHLFGYDAVLIRAALETDPAVKSKLMMRYLISRFDLFTKEFNLQEEDQKAAETAYPEDTVEGAYPTNLFDVLNNNGVSLLNKLGGNLDKDILMFFREFLTELRATAKASA